MGLPLTKIDDYEGGCYKLPSNDLTYKDIESVIECNEESILCDLLGKELYDLFIADLDGTTNLPQTDRFIKIYNKFFEKINDCLSLSSKGVPEMLKAFVFFSYIRDNNTHNTLIGAQGVNADNSQLMALNRTKSVRAYNEGVETYKAIQSYISNNKDVYPEYEGVKKCYLTIF